MGGQNPNAGVAGGTNDSTNAALQMYNQQLAKSPMLGSQPLYVTNSAPVTNIEATGQWSDANAHPEQVGQAWVNAANNILSSAGSAYLSKVIGDHNAMQQNKEMLQNSNADTAQRVIQNGPQAPGNLSDRSVSMNPNDPKYLDFLRSLGYQG